VASYFSDLGPPTITGRHEPISRRPDVRERLYHDFKFYAQHSLFIRAKDQKVIPLVLNKAQRLLLEAVNRQLERRSFVRLIILNSSLALSGEFKRRRSRCGHSVSGAVVNDFCCHHEPVRVGRRADFPSQKLLRNRWLKTVPSGRQGRRATIEDAHRGPLYQVTEQGAWRLRPAWLTNWGRGGSSIGCHHVLMRDMHDAEPGVNSAENSNLKPDAAGVLGQTIARNPRVRRLTVL
jgi:hypothetical protein